MLKINSSNNFRDKCNSFSLDKVLIEEVYVKNEFDTLQEAEKQALAIANSSDVNEPVCVFSIENRYFHVDIGSDLIEELCKDTDAIKAVTAIV